MAARLVEERQRLEAGHQLQLQQQTVQRETVQRETMERLTQAKTDGQWRLEQLRQQHETELVEARRVAEDRVRMTEAHASTQIQELEGKIGRVDESVHEANLNAAAQVAQARQEAYDEIIQARKLVEVRVEQLQVSRISKAAVSLHKTLRKAQAADWFDGGTAVDEGRIRDGAGEPHRGGAAAGRARAD